MNKLQNYKLLSLLAGTISVVLIISILFNFNSWTDKQDSSTVNIQLGYESLQFDIPIGWHINTNPNWISNTSDTLTIISQEEVKHIPSFVQFPVTITTKTKTEMLNGESFESYYESNYPRQSFQSTELTQLSENAYRIDGMRIDADNQGTESEGIDLFIIGEFNVFWIMLNSEHFDHDLENDFIDSLEYSFDDSI